MSFDSHRYFVTKPTLAFLSLLFVFMVQSAVNASVDLSTGSVTLETVLKVAGEENPEIIAARKKWDAARARISQAVTPDKPRVDIERMYAPRDKDVISGADEKNVAVSQEIPFPTTLYLKGRVAQKEAQMAEAAYHAKEREILSRVKNAYAMLFLSHHAIHIFEANTDLMRRFSKVAEAKYSSGKAAQVDVLKAQVELSKMLNMLVTLGQEKETNQAMLNVLLNRPPQDYFGMPEDLKFEAIKENLDQLQALAIEKRPELQEAKLGVERNRTNVGVARSEYLPDIMLQYRRRNMMGGPDTHDAMVGFSVPLWFWKQGAMVKEAKAEREMAEAEYQTMKNMTLFDVKNLLVKLQTTARLIDLYQTSVLPQSEQALKVAQAGYQSDKTGFLDMLDAARTFLDFRLEHYQYLAEAQVFLADLERAVGTDLKEAR